MRKKNLRVAAATALAMMLAINAPAMAQEIDFDVDDNGLDNEVSYDLDDGQYLYLGYPYLWYYPHLGYEIDFDDHDLGDNDFDEFDDDEVHFVDVDKFDRNDRQDNRQDRREDRNDNKNNGGNHNNNNVGNGNHKAGR